MTDYELIDAGDGEKLERLGGVLVARPAPAAREAKRTPEIWEAAAARFDAHGGWRVRDPLPEPWLARAHGLSLRLETTSSGQVGWFPEKNALVDQLAASVEGGASSRTSGGQPTRVLHLFAYTGAASLAFARAGAHVTHVDAASSAVAWARHNAALNALEHHPIRWIVEDATRWVAREARRGARYDGILLDPPSFGRARGGRTWKLGRDLMPLLAGCASLLSNAPLFLAAAAHTEGMDAVVLASMVDRALAGRGGRTVCETIELRAQSGARVSAGVVARRAFAE